MLQIPSTPFQNHSPYKLGATKPMQWKMRKIKVSLCLTTHYSMEAYWEVDV
jgi:hypothetical protein